jgi:ketosteroid isomerase-like protein
MGRQTQARWIALLVVGLAGGGTAAAEPRADAATLRARFHEMLREPPGDLRDARFGFGVEDVVAEPAPAGALESEFDMMAVADDKVTVGFSAKGDAAWLAADLSTTMTCGDESCPKKPRIMARYHVTALFVAGAEWQPVFWHVAYQFEPKEYTASLTRGTVLDAVDDRATKADDVVALFKTSMADPAALAGTVSSRADVVLYGTDRKERYLGGKAVAAQLRKWNLGFTVKDGVTAGITPSGTIAWVAANVDAVSRKKPGAPAPYRVTAIYEQVGGAWKLVNLHFSFVR